MNDDTTCRECNGSGHYPCRGSRQILIECRPCDGTGLTAYGRALDRTAARHEVNGDRSLAVAVRDLI